MLAMLLATMSSSRPSTICRDKPTRRAFSIGTLPLGAWTAPSPAPPRACRVLSQAAADMRIAEAVPMTKVSLRQILGLFPAGYGRAETAVVYLAPGKNFPPAAGEQVSVNH